MFVNKQQRAEACFLLLRLASENFAMTMWHDPRISNGSMIGGPAPAGIAKLKNALEGDGHTLSHGEKLLLQVTFDVWNGSGHAHLHEVLEQLMPHQIGAIGTLCDAIARGQVQQWIERLTHDLDAQ